MHPRSVFQEKLYFLNYNLSEIEEVIEINQTGFNDNNIIP